MNRTLIVMILALTIVGCASSRKSSTTSVSGDGTSFQTAVIAKSIASEYEWIREHYPGSKVVQQALVSEKGRRYDVLTTKLADGSTKEFYFNIDSFFGKGF